MSRLANHPMHQPTLELADALRVAGEPHAELYQDGTSGGLICVRIPLTEDTSEFSTSYYIACEGSESEHPVYVWTGQLVLADGDVGDVTHAAVERPWEHDDSEAAKAYLAKHFVPVIRLQRELLPAAAE